MDGSRIGLVTAFELASRVGTDHKLLSEDMKTFFCLVADHIEPIEGDAPLEPSNIAKEAFAVWKKEAKVLQRL